jgi:hypothetical protein
MYFASLFLNYRNSGKIKFGTATTSFPKRNKYSAKKCQTSVGVKGSNTLQYINGAFTLDVKSV